MESPINFNNLINNIQDNLNENKLILFDHLKTEGYNDDKSFNIDSIFLH